MSFKELNAEVIWNQEDKSIEAKNEDMRIKLQIDILIFKKDDEEIELDSARMDK